MEQGKCDREGMMIDSCEGDGTRKSVIERDNKPRMIAFRRLKKGLKKKRDNKPGMIALRRLKKGRDGETRVYRVEWKKE